jgi:outer membrane receptor protein involved in Fe transport
MRADSKYPFTLVNGTIKTREKRINSDIETARIEANMYGDFGEAGGSLETKLYVFHSGRGLPGAVNFYTVSSNERLWNDNSFFQARYQNRLNEHFTIQTIAKYAYSRLRYRIKDDNYAAGFREDHNTQHEYYVSAGVLYTPLNCLSASLTTDYANTKLNNNFVNAAQPRRNTSLTAFAVQYKRDALTATGSLLGTYISDGVQNGDRPADRKHLSPAVAFSWRPYPNNALRIRASYKDIFRVPTFADLYYLRVGSAGLKPEKAKQYNAGLTWSGTAGHIFRHLSISIDGYYNRVSDKIVALPTLYIWRMMNMGTVEIKGVDINIATEIPLHTKINMTLSGNNTFQHAIDITHPEAKNYRNQIPYTPRNSGNGSVAFETPWVNVSYILTTVSERYALPQNTKANRLNAYTEQSIQMNRTFNTKHFSVRIQGEILNLADTQYDVIQYYPMPGRAWRLSLTLFN